MSYFSKIRSSLARVIAPDSVRRFEAAGGGRRFSAGQQFHSYRNEASVAGPQLRSRARHAVENSPIANNAVATWANALVGCGITITPIHSDPEIQKALTKIFTDWSENPDSEGHTNWTGLQNLITTGLVRDGESLVLMRETVDGVRLQVLPPEWLKSVAGEIASVDGIEFNDQGQRVAYHVQKSDLTVEIVRLDARDVCHVFVKKGAGQQRGVSWLAPVLLTLSDYDQLADALLVSAKIAAMHTGWIQDNADMAGSPYEGQADANGDLSLSLEPGVVRKLGAGQTITFSSPQQLPTAIEFSRLTLRSVSAGLGLPDWALSHDVSTVNYSTARAALNQWRTRVEGIQWGVLLPQLIKPIYERVITSAILAGQIDIPLEEALAFEAHMPRWNALDPEKEAQAEILNVSAGFKSRRMVVAENGYDVTAVDSEIAADKAREKLLGLSFETAPNTGVPPNAATA
jgi:lambda family phage portal protein